MPPQDDYLSSEEDDCNDFDESSDGRNSVGETRFWVYRVCMYLCMN